MLRNLACAIVGIFVVVAGYAWSKARFEAKRQNRQTKMCVVMGAIASYDDIHKSLPVPIYKNEMGDPLRSWRAEILPLMSTPSTLPNKQARWDEASNRGVTSVPSPGFCFGVEGRGDALNTNIVAVTGEGTAFDSATPRRLSEVPSDTIVLMEVHGLRIPWAAPGDLDIRSNLHQITFGTDGKGVHVAFADQQVWYLQKDVPLSSLRQFFRVEDAARMDRDVVLGTYRLR